MNSAAAIHCASAYKGFGALARGHTMSGSSPMAQGGLCAPVTPQLAAVIYLLRDSVVDLPSSKTPWALNQPEAPPEGGFDCKAEEG